MINMGSKFGKRVCDGQVRVSSGQEDWHLIMRHKFVVVGLDATIFLVAIIVAGFIVIVLVIIVAVIIVAGFIVVGLVIVMVVITHFKITMGFVSLEDGGSVYRLLMNRRKSDEIESPLH
jgi:Mn2+/Fe2+ NRAMP family transporter